MSNVLIDRQKIDILANAISDKSGVPVTMTLDEMVEAVDSIETGGGEPNLQAKTYTVDSAGTETVTADSGYDGLSEVEVSVPQGEMHANYRALYKTVSNVRKWEFTPIAEVVIGDGYGTPGFIDDETIEYGNSVTYNAIAKNTSVTPTTSAQTIGGADYMMEGAVTVSAMPTGTAGTPTATKGTVSNHQVSVTPSVTNTTGYITGGTKNGTAVTVSASELVSGTLSVTSNGTKDVTNYASVNVNISSEAPTIESLSVTPSESEQTFNASTVDGYKPITVSAISSTYVGSGITRRSSSDLTVSGATVTASAGYYSAAASKSVASMTLPTSAASSATSGYTSKATIGRSTAAQYINVPPGYNSTGAYYVISATPNGSVTAPASISGTAASVSTGTNILTLTKTVSVTPNVTTAGYISSGTAGNSSVTLTASVTTKAAATITPTTTNQTIAAGTYLTGTQTIAGDADLVGSNILSTANIFGVQGTVDFIDVYIRSAAPTSSVGSDGDIYIQE